MLQLQGCGQEYIAAAERHELRSAQRGFGRPLLYAVVCGVQQPYIFLAYGYRVTASAPCLGCKCSSCCFDRISTAQDAGSVPATSHLDCSHTVRAALWICSHIGHLAGLSLAVAANPARPCLTPAVRPCCGRKVVGRDAVLQVFSGVSFVVASRNSSPAQDACSAPATTRVDNFLGQLSVRPARQCLWKSCQREVYRICGLARVDLYAASLCVTYSMIALRFAQEAERCFSLVGYKQTHVKR